MSNKLVAYFSASGVTAGLAKTLAEETGADLYEIKPEVPYTKADLDWTDKKSRSTIEMQDPSFRPAIADKDANIADYDVVFVGFPIWWYVAPTIINTFLESYDFSGKTIVPFATSGSSGLGQTGEKLKPSVSRTAILKEGKLLKGGLSKNEMEKWIAGLNL
jgi:flavodoxin